jgi:hypothetical protein
MLSLRFGLGFSRGNQFLQCTTAMPRDNNENCGGKPGINPGKLLIKGGEITLEL